MATVYQQAPNGPYWTTVKLWKANLGKWVWQRLPTHVYDKDDALQIGRLMEKASADTKAGNMDRLKAAKLVERVLSYAGLDINLTPPTLKKFGEDFFAIRHGSVAGATKKKYSGHWTRFSAWSGNKMDWLVTRWQPADFTAYYLDLLGEVSSTTANDHMRTLSMLFIRACDAGIVDSNPLALVERVAGDSTARVPFSRQDVTLLLRYFRRMKQDNWVVLVLLGWHTGHRIDDLAWLDSNALIFDKTVGWTLTITPAKKEGSGGRVVILPIPAYLAKMFQRVGNLLSLLSGDNTNGRISSNFITEMESAGVDPMRVQKKKNIVPLKSFHSFRHSMATRLTAAGVPSNLARLVTDHDSEQVHKKYTHAEVSSLAGALKKARRV